MPSSAALKQRPEVEIQQPVGAKEAEVVLFRKSSRVEEAYAALNEAIRANSRPELAEHYKRHEFLWRRSVSICGL